MASMYGVYHGPDGLRRIAGRIHRHANLLADGLQKAGFTIKNNTWFDTLTVQVGTSGEFETIRERALSLGINFRYETGSLVGISVDETCTSEELSLIMYAMTGKQGWQAPTTATTQGIPSGQARQGNFMQQEVFNRYHSETELMRYIKKLENRDLALNHSMIPLGSCTMKLNAASELIPLSLPEFANLHPFIPEDQAAGYHQIFEELSEYLCKATGFSAISLQPNSGAQGEYAGLMVIRAYHQAQGAHDRHVALIPSSAHGTNPASAVMAGMEVVVVKCDTQGNVDIADLRAKAEQYSNVLSCLMITYPSTHGVFEEGIIEITQIIHQHGGLVYMDGANMNAQVGLTNPGSIGADVCHLNLHKTFAIPHGGGGPGMGPIAVNDKLAPFLPGHALVKTGGSQRINAISAGPFGSSLILLVSYAYIRMLGSKGLTNSTKMAILNANYLKARLEPYYPVLYRGKAGNVAHEMILDCRDFKRTARIEVADIAKRLMDYGYHAPTVSFPVPGTIMVEPTESEGKEELDRFCEAMISIRNEIREIEEGSASAENNVIINAPHTSQMVISDTWSKPYSREKAVFPLSWIRSNKFWPSVGKVDNAYGDRNLVCSCEPIESYMKEEVLSE
jgi:glycine dehydrogenase